jgi:hypothetical protein
MLHNSTILGAWIKNVIDDTLRRYHVFWDDCEM